MTGYTKLITHRLLPVATLLLAITVPTAGCANNHSEETKQQKLQTLQQGMAMKDSRKDGGRVIARSLQVADQAAARIAELEQVQQAYVLLYDGDAYVALQLLRDRMQVPGDVQAAIVERVKETVPAVGDVYIGTNLTFVDWIYSYVRNVNSGRSDQGLELQIKRLLKHSFTDRHQIP